MTKDIDMGLDLIYQNMVEEFGDPYAPVERPATDLINGVEPRADEEIEESDTEEKTAKPKPAKRR